MTWEEIKKLSKEELLKLVSAYDDYVINFQNEHEGTGFVEDEMESLENFFNGVFKPKRTCRNCGHFIPKSELKDDLCQGQGMCYEGGDSDIGDPDRFMSDNDCNAWYHK